MAESTTFSTRSNAKRAAEKAIDAGTAASIDYGLHTHEDGRIEIVWKAGPTPAEADERDTDIAQEALGEIEAGNEGLVTGDELQERFDSWESESEEDKVESVIAEAAVDTSVDDASDGEQNMPDRFPPGARVIVQVTARKRRTGTVDHRVDATSCRVKFDGPYPSVLCRYNQLSLDDGSEPIPMPVKAERRKSERQQGERKPGKSAELDAAAARGEMPTKPIITSAANQKQYQPRFDQLEAWAKAGNWDAVRSYEVKGINSYAKMVKQYRERLLAAHAASEASDKAA